MTGAIAAGFHEGSRSEYLAQYVFSMFGTCVQVQSTARLRVYQLTARFRAAVLTGLSARLALIPAAPGDGRDAGVWDGEGNLPLSAPILDFTIAGLLDDRRFVLYREILLFWVRNDVENIRRQQAGTRTATGPDSYTTNEMPRGGRSTSGMMLITPEARAVAGATAVEQLHWLAKVMLTDSDRLGALIAALMLRHLVPDSEMHAAVPRLEDIYIRLREGGQLDATVGTAATDYAAAPIDKLLVMMQEMCDPNPARDPSQPRLLSKQRDLAAVSVRKGRIPRSLRSRITGGSVRAVMSGDARSESHKIGDLSLRRNRRDLL